SRTILRALLTRYMQDSSSHAIGASADVLDVFLLGADTAVVNTSAGFAESHPSGVLAEELTVASMALTLNANDPRITRVKILVDGKERQTLAGHVDLSRFYTSSDFELLVRDVK
ncbi:MAG TPA: GerMN domain-containing protein, partial [Candidatus Methylomirabilis sp.]|nr:GerMN domain-containing protein [Candidatus Methylomirabilis sp.]